MPPRTNSLLKTSSLPSKDAFGLFFCPYCPQGRSSLLPWPRIGKARFSRRSAGSREARLSTLASSTAINPTKDTPQNLQELYSALTAVRDRAANYVSLSRLQLALRGLETKRPVVRIAVLGVGDQKSACQVAKILLADPLSPESPWETSLEALGGLDGRSLLLRYGETPGIEMENSLLRILLIQSPILKRFNLEILVSHIDTTRSVSMDQGLAISTKHDILVPSLELQASADGRSTVIGYPVHKALLYGRGVGDALAIGRFTASWLGRGSYSDMIQFAIDLNLPPDTHNDQAEGRVIAVDIERASSALQRFRVSPQNATLFEEQWFQSRVPTLVAWLFQDLDDRNRSLKAPIRHLIQSLLEDSDRKITEAELANVRSIAESSVPEDTRQNLQESLSIWAEHAHAELRQELDSAFHGRRWRRLKWWKLFWRVDDVDMIASEILQRRWLVQAEKDLIWIAGRIEGVGFFRSTKSPAPITSPSSERVEESQSRQTSGRNPPLPSFTGTTVSTADEGIVQLPPFGPWPLHISLARVHLLNETIPSLEWLGQVLTLQTLSTVILSSATSALLYVSWSGASAYEASAVAGLGIVWSMRRLQRRWEKARGFWESEVREEGRKALKETEDTVATIIETEGRFKEDVADVEERNAARASIDQARQALEQLR